jgi:hypothetical protein
MAQGISQAERPQRPTVAAPLFWQMLGHYFSLDEKQQARVWGAIGQSRWSAVREWRQAVLLLDTLSPSIDTVMTFLEQSTPPERLLEVLEGLVLEGLLQQHEVAAIEERVLTMVRPDGKWK